MSVKRYDLIGDMDGNCNLNEARMESSEDGVYVKHRDYVELEQQLAESHRALRAETTAHENTQMQLEKMAAENARIKNSIPKLKDIDYENDNMDDVSLAEDVGFNDAVTLMSRWMPETPATDSFLAEVRASGVEIFGQWLRDSADIFDKNSRHDWADQNRVSADKAGEFAENLRKGVQS